MSDRCKHPGCASFADSGGHCLAHEPSFPSLPPGVALDWWQEDGNRLGDRVVKMEKVLERMEKKLDQVLEYLEPQFELTVDGLVKPIDHKESE